MSLLRKINDNLIGSKNLSVLSSKLHLVISVVLIIQNIPITVYRYLHYPIIITWINVIEISIYLIAILIYFKKKFLLSIMTTAVGIPLLFSYFTFIQPVTTSHDTFLFSYWFVLCFMLIYTTIIRGNKFRILYILFVFIIYFIPGAIIAFNYPGNLIKLIQFFTLTLIPLIISSFIENQDNRITDLNKSLKLRLLDKERLTKKIEEKNEELITFSHIMGHDLKAPLRTINSFTQLLRSKINFEDDENEEYFQFIEDSSKTMKVLIDDLMIYYKIDAEENISEIVDVQILVQNIKKNHQFELNNGRLEINVINLPEIKGYKNLLRTLFHNLISNSIKFQPKDKIDHVPHVTLSSSQDDTQISILVSDNGIGIADNYANKLFAPFQRFHNSTDYEGTGLGMSICKRVMDKHGGQISVEETSPNGTTIKLVFPRKS